MHLFAALIDLPEIATRQLRYGLAELAIEFGLDPATAWSAGSRDGRLRAAGVHHAPERSAPRRYLEHAARRVTGLDGPPVARRDGLDARAAGALARCWPQLDGLLDGQFCAVDVDLEALRV